MDYRQTMKELRSRGTAQNRKVYARHGVGGDMFGVSYADLGKLRKRIKTDHQLAERLWASGNHDARVLAAMVADPASTTRSGLDAWARDVDSYPLAGAVAGLAARSPHARSRMEKWTKSKREFIGEAGWNLVASLAMKDGELPDAHFEERLEQIEARIHSSANRVRYAMNNALIAIGLRSARLERLAIAAARRIGPVEVDHGETGCKTPEAVAYIRRAKSRKRKPRGARG